MEKTLVLIKPDAISRKLVGKIISYYEDKMLKISEVKLIYPTEYLLSEHYKEHLGKPFYESLLTFMLSGPSIAMVLEGEFAVARVREVNGATNPTDAAIGTIRGDLGENTSQNLVHGSDSLESARREIALWFTQC